MQGVTTMQIIQPRWVEAAHAWFVALFSSYRRELRRVTTLDIPIPAHLRS